MTRPFVAAVSSILVIFVLTATSANGQDRPPTGDQPDVAVLEKRLADLERQLAAMQKELHEVRQQLRDEIDANRLALAPEAAVESSQRDPGKPVTVEFRVGSVSWLGFYRDDESPGQFRLAWDGRLKDGGVLCVDLDLANDSDSIKLPSAPSAEGITVPVQASTEDPKKKFVELRGKTIRVTGPIELSAGKSRPEGGLDYYMIKLGRLDQIHVVESRRE